MFIGEEHSPTVNDCLAWTAIDRQLSLGSRSSLCPQPRSKQRHFLHKINTATLGSCSTSIRFMIKSCWGQSSRTHLAILGKDFAPTPGHQCHNTEANAILENDSKSNSKRIAIKCDLYYLIIYLFSLVNKRLRGDVVTVMSLNQQSVSATG